MRTFGIDWDTKLLWQTYVMLTEVEQAFRYLKTNLGLRPIFHKTGPRVDAHLFITTIAYHIMQTILYQLKFKGLYFNWETLLHRMGTQNRVTATIKLKNNKTVHIRSATKPELNHNEIYNALGIVNMPGTKIKIYQIDIKTCYHLLFLEQSTRIYF